MAAAGHLGTRCGTASTPTWITSSNRADKHAGSAAPGVAGVAAAEVVAIPPLPTLRVGDVRPVRLAPDRPGSSADARIAGRAGSGGPRRDRRSCGDHRAVHAARGADGGNAPPGGGRHPLTPPGLLPATESDRRRHGCVLRQLPPGL